MCFYNNTMHIVEMFYDKNCQVYDVFTLLDSVYLYEDTVHIVKKIVKSLKLEVIHLRRMIKLHILKVNKFLYITLIF